MLWCLSHLTGFYTQDRSSREIPAPGEVLHGRVLTVLLCTKIYKIVNLSKMTDAITGSLVQY